MADKINPEHYKRGGLETIDIMKKKLTPEEYIGKMKGDQYKYLERRGYKETEGLSELQWNENCAVECRKQMWYTEKELNVYLENIAAIKAKVQSDEWIDDPLHDED